MAISRVYGPTAISEGTTAIDLNGADYVTITISAVHNGFATGDAVPTTLTYAGAGFVQLYVGTDGNSTTNALSIYGLKAPASGSNNLIIDVPGSSYDGGPVIVVEGFTGCVQSDTASDVRRTAVQDNSFGSSVSLAYSGLTAGDWIMYRLNDYSDTAHAATGVAVEDLEATNNSFTVWCGSFTATGTSHTGGANGGSFLWGAAIALIPAAAAAATLSNPGICISIG